VSNKKSGCLFCKEKAYHSSFNFRPFLRVITKYRDKEIDREIFYCGIDCPLPTGDTSNRFALLEPLLTDFRFSNKPYPASNPLGTVVTKSHIGLLEPSVNPRLDIRFRMLKNHELKKAQGFPDDYVITGNTTEQTKQIGNAVPVNTAKALALVTMGVTA
jgi:hypothetical protein